MVISPMLEVQVTPSCSEIAFIELLTRHAPVPQDNSIRPTLPIRAAFTGTLASVIGLSFTCPV